MQQSAALCAGTCATSVQCVVQSLSAGFLEQMATRVLLLSGQKQLRSVLAKVEHANVPATPAADSTNKRPASGLEIMGNGWLWLATHTKQSGLLVNGGRN